MSTPSNPTTGDPPPPLRRRVRARLSRAWNQGWIGSVRVGVRLGLATPETLNELDERYYSGGKQGEHIDYASDAHNRRGLASWERDAVKQFFPKTGRLLVLGAGGGREVLALARMGYAVDGFEPHAGLVAAANDLLTREGVADARVEIVARDAPPRTGGRYDGLIIGWASYTLIQGRARRVELLKSLRAAAAPGAPLLVSFWLRDYSPYHHGLLTRTGNALRALRRLDPLDDGDALSPNYVHFFTEAEVSAELRAGGWAPVFYSTEGTPHAVGLATGAAGG